MEVPSPSDLTVRLDPSELRRRVDVMSADARLERADQATAEALLGDARRAVAEARMCLAVAEASLDARALADRKDEARRGYRQALVAARGPEERRAAAATWLGTVDAINRSTRAALGQVLLWRERSRACEQQVRDAERRASAQRVRAEAAEDSCARVRSDLADTDRWQPGPPTMSPRPVLAGLLDSDAAMIQDLAGQMADLTGDQASRWALLFRGLTDALVRSAMGHDRLRFDAEHPLWAQLTHDEARSVVGRLRDLGFRYDPVEGWYGDRAPRPRDLGVALGYVGIEAVTMRPLPSSVDLQALPASISVATYDHVLEEAPDLALDTMHRLAGRDARDLGDLWDHWADVRELLLGDPELVAPA